LQLNKNLHLFLRRKTFHLLTSSILVLKYLRDAKRVLVMS